MTGVQTCALPIYPVAAYRTIRKELKAYSELLAAKTEIVAFNKIDAIDEKDLAKKLADFKKRVKLTPILISGATQKGVDAAMKKLLTIITAAKKQQRKEEAPGVMVEDWHP